MTDNVNVNNIQTQVQETFYTLSMTWLWLTLKKTLALSEGLSFYVTAEAMDCKELTKAGMDIVVDLKHKFKSTKE